MNAGVEKEALARNLEGFFSEHAHACGISMCFLYGSWAGGKPTKESDVDIALVPSGGMHSEDEIFDMLARLSAELSLNLGREVNLLPIIKESWKPMLYYNAIVLGEPLYVRERRDLQSLVNEAVFQMEDFSILGVKLQLDAARRNLEKLANA
ncbi:MAG: nucleotidyltransferase domain-containing protein [Pseudomonadota bacterium]